LTQPKSPLTIRLLKPADLPAADEVLKAAFATPDSRAAELRRYLRLQPDGWLAALSGRTLVGMVGALDYGSYAHIGFMAVHPEYQRQGIGRAQMETLLRRLDARGCPQAILDATPQGEPLYNRLGFVGDQYSQVFVQSQPCQTSLPGGRISALTARDLPDLAALDQAVFGADRLRVLKAYLSEHGRRAFGVRDESGGLSGYLIAQGRRIGPWVARRSADAELLLRAALSLPYDGPPRVIVPSVNLPAARLLPRYGFQLERENTHMRRGGRRFPGERRFYYGLASFAIG
jgi:predicted N-acetyltransferase YhbS